jgi:3-phenylpropionate/trans-cinnamate dioxygenase ferredoxin reductase subunit
MFYFRDDICVALDTINRPRDHMAARRLLPTASVTKSQLAEVEFDISALMKR